jgi:hypothetical protein
MVEDAHGVKPLSSVAAAVRRQTAQIPKSLAAQALSCPRAYCDGVASLAGAPRIAAAAAGRNALQIVGLTRS